jgi:hypothetical protein
VRARMIKARPQQRRGEFVKRPLPASKFVLYLQSIRARAAGVTEVWWLCALKGVRCLLDFRRLLPRHPRVINKSALVNLAGHDGIIRRVRDYG